MNSQTKAERRKHQRFQVAGNAFMVNSSLNGLIENISLDGLAFRYVDRKSRKQETHFFDIVVDEENFHLDHLPYKVIADKETTHNCPDPSLIVKKRSVQFTHLSPNQKEQLVYFIKHYAADPV